MRITALPYMLELKHRFTLSTTSRTTTPVVLVRIESEGLTGFGEASLPPYLPETQTSVLRFLATLDLSVFRIAHGMDVVLDAVDGASPGDCAAKAAIDIALHDLFGKASGDAWWRHWGLDRMQAPPTSFTIGIGSADEVRRKTAEASGFRMLKVKLGRENDREIVRAIRDVTDTPLCVDVNQGWSDKYEALDRIGWCREQGVVFVEQPLPKERIDDTAWLTERSPLPVIADESFQRLSDLDRVAGVFSGVNVKLMKCAGMREARRIVDAARERGLRVMLGCMTETSCAISAAAQLSPLVDWADLDGALLVSNDCFQGARLQEGRMVPVDAPGIGAFPDRDLPFADPAI